jgi:hypothetical protein
MPASSCRELSCKAAAMANFLESIVSVSGFEMLRLIPVKNSITLTVVTNRGQVALRWLADQHLFQCGQANWQWLCVI